MTEKPINWRGSALRDLKDDAVFTVDARREAGHQLSKVQAGAEPDVWKPFTEVGPGTKEIIIDTKDGWFRVMYVAKFEEAVYVLHCFRKKTNATTKQDKDVAKQRYADVVRERKAHEN